MKTIYEFDWEITSKDGDVLDHDHFFNCNHKTSVAEAKKLLAMAGCRIDLSSLDPHGITKEKNEDGSHGQFVIVKNVLDDEGFLNDREWAYLNENNELDEFSDGSTVPQFVKKFFKLATELGL